MNWVYSAATEKPERDPVVEQIGLEAGFTSSLPGPDGSYTSKQTEYQQPQLVTGGVGHLEVGRYSIVLTIFTAEVDVNLSKKLLAELHRSTKKNPPRALKYELIYVRHSPTPATRNADMLSRWGRTNTMQVREEVVFGPWQQVVFSKACARTWMGEDAFATCIPLLTLA